MNPLLLAGFVLAQAQCGPWPAMLTALRDQHQETPTAGGVGERALYVLFTSPSGSWSLVARRPADGLSCILAAGQGWVLFPSLPEGDPS